MKNLKNDYEFNLLKIENYNLSPRMIYLKKYLENHKNLEGDYYEFGVFRGNSLLSVALLFRKLGIKKKIYGFDTFQGFPKYHPKDSFENFKKLNKEKKISSSHLKMIENFQKIKLFNSNSISKSKNILKPRNISSSKDFSNNSLSFIKQRIKFFSLKNIYLIKGDFEKTIPLFFKKNPRKKIFVANIDCDLYNSYKTVLNNIWPQVSNKGLLLLDEYFSLKFPGARIATNEFFKFMKKKPFKVKTWEGDFERWYVKK